MDREQVQKNVQQNVKKQATRTVKRKAKKKIKRIHPLSFVVWIVALALGVALGAGACAFLCRNDGFELVGKSEIIIPLEEGKTYEYTDKGAKAVSFGRNISRSVRVETDLKEIDDGVYEIDASCEGSYYIVYTVDDARFGEIKRVRTITVGGE